MKKFETVVILDERAAENQAADFPKEFEELVTSNGGKMIETLPMGKKQLAYPIRKRKAGTYFDFKYELTPDKASAPRDKYRLDERILRLRTYVMD